jgi:hypothetical protein
VQELEGHEAVELGVAGAPDGPEGAGPDLAQDLEAAQGADLVGGGGRGGVAEVKRAAAAGADDRGAAVVGPREGAAAVGAADGARRVRPGGVAVGGGFAHGAGSGRRTPPIIKEEMGQR